MRRSPRRLSVSDSSVGTCCARCSICEVPQSSPVTFVKPGSSVQYVLVLARAADFTADSVAAWHGIQTQQHLPLQSDFIHYNFDESIDVLVLLDLLDRLRAQFFTLVILSPPASTWSRARQTGTGQCRFSHFHSRWASPMGPPTITIASSTPTKPWRCLGGSQRQR